MKPGKEGNHTALTQQVLPILPLASRQLAQKAPQLQPLHPQNTYLPSSSLEELRLHHQCVTEHCTSNV